MHKYSDKCILGSGKHLNFSLKNTQVERVFMNNKLVFTTVFIIIWTIATVLALTWGNRLDWPDNVHLEYGFPLVWATNTLSTIVGAVNVWNVDISALTIDLIFWLGIMLVASVVLMYLIKRK
jgi:hypothetical protein